MPSPPDSCLFCRLVAEGEHASNGPGGILTREPGIEGVVLLGVDAIGLQGFEARWHAAETVHLLELRIASSKCSKSVDRLGERA